MYYYYRNLLLFARIVWDTTIQKNFIYLMVNLINATNATNTARLLLAVGISSIMLNNNLASRIFNVPSTKSQD